MPSTTSDPAPTTGQAKVVITGGIAAGKSVFVRSMSAAPLTRLTDLMPVTTDHGPLQVRLETEYGQRMLPNGVLLQLLSLAAEAAAFPSLWPGYTRHALGSVLLVRPGADHDARRHRALLEDADLPYIICRNTPRPSLEPGEDSGIPVIDADVADSAQARHVLVALVERVQSMVTA